MLESAIMQLALAAEPENIWEITVEPYTDLLGGLFWSIILFLLAGLVYLKTQSFGPTFLTLAIGGVILTLYVPGDAQVVIIFATALGITYTFYQLLVRRKYP